MCHYVPAWATEKDCLDLCIVFVGAWHKPLPRVAQKNCYAVYTLNLIHELTSVFSSTLIYGGLLRKAFPRKQACRHQCFSAVAQATAKIPPRPVQGRIMQEGARGSARHIPAQDSIQYPITHVEQEKGCPYQALATPQLRFKHLELSAVPR